MKWLAGRWSDVLRFTLRLLALAIFAVVMVITDDAFVMVGGSESTSFLIAPPVAVQLVCLACWAVCLFFRSSTRVIAARALVGLAAVALGEHRLVVDNLHGEIKDVYLGLTTQSLRLDPADETGIAVRLGWVGVRVVERGASLWCLSPLGVGLDRGALAKITQ